jgi:glycosyltransferase involved in cell wall biosynthesis
MASAGRVLIIVENLPLPFDRRVWLEAMTLTANGYQVSAICPMGKGFDRPYEFLGGVHIYRHPLPVEGTGPKSYAKEYGAALWHQFRLAFKIYRRHGFDVIHACNPPDDIFMVALPFKLLCGVRFIFDHHDVNPELYVAKFGRRDPFYALMKILERWTFRLADVSIATNLSYRRVAVERGKMRPEDVFVVRSGPRQQSITAPPPRPELKRGRRFLVAYVGVMAQQDGLDLLLRAARHMVYDRGRTDVAFTLVGAGPELAALKEMSADLGLADHVRFTGRIPDKDLFEVLSTADVCVDPDVVNPMNDMSTMNKIMEYMAFGKPVVMFDLTEHKYSAQEAGVTARANDPMDLGDKIVDLLDDPERREAMGLFGRRRFLDELAWEHSAPHLLAAYRRALDRHPTGSSHASR